MTPVAMNARTVFRARFYTSKRAGKSDIDSKADAVAAVAAAEATIIGGAQTSATNPDYTARKAAFDALGVASWPVPLTDYAEVGTTV